MVMTAAAVRVKSSKGKGQAFSDSQDGQDIFDNLMIKLPAGDTWDAEFCLKVLVLG
jgi:hypothetical protein